MRQEVKNFSELMEANIKRHDETRGLPTATLNLETIYKNV